MSRTKIQLPASLDLVKFIQACYNLSRPQGMGCLMPFERALSDEEARQYLEGGNSRVALSLDYVNGRACKMVVWRETEGEGYYTYAPWYDHTPAQLRALLEQFNLPVPAESAHTGACNCGACP